MRQWGNPEGRYPEPMESAEDWTVERHLADKPKDVVDLYERFLTLVAACGPFSLSVTKTAVAFKGTHRGFAGAKPRKSSLDGFLDLQREVHDEEIPTGVALHQEPLRPSVSDHERRAARRFICTLGGGGISSRVWGSPRISEDWVTAPARRFGETLKPSYAAEFEASTRAMFK